MNVENYHLLISNIKKLFNIFKKSRKLSVELIEAAIHEGKLDSYDNFIIDKVIDELVNEDEIRNTCYKIVNSGNIDDNSEIKNELVKISSYSTLIGKNNLLFISKNIPNFKSTLENRVSRKLLEKYDL